MKNLLFFAIFFGLSQIVTGQTDQCDCSGPLNKDLKNVLVQSEYEQFKNWLYTYIGSTKESRKKLKRKRNISFSGGFETVVDALPIGGNSEGSYSNDKVKSNFERLKIKYINNQYLDNNDINELATSVFGDDQLSGYKACLDLCAITNGNGVYYYKGGDFSDEFYIKVKYDSNSGGEKITLRSNAKYSYMTPIGENLFIRGLVIEKGGSVTQYFKRTNKNKRASFQINTVEPIGNNKAIEFEAIEKHPKNQNSIPIGSIIASVLPYDSFLEVNGYEKTTDITKAVWVPCDGREVSASTYGKRQQNKAPDLRGLFIRGINSYNDKAPGVGEVSEENANPENKAANEFQPDSFQNHVHQIGVGASDKRAPTQNANSGNGKNRFPDFQEGSYKLYSKPVYSLFNNKNIRFSEETRPKNLTVYYYVKINN